VSAAFALRSFRSECTGISSYIRTTIEVVRQNTEMEAGNVAVPKLLGMSFAKNKNPMYVCDLNTLAFLDVNDAAVRDYGHSRRWFLGATILDIRPTTRNTKTARADARPKLEEVPKHDGEVAPSDRKRDRVPGNDQKLGTDISRAFSQAGPSERKQSMILAK
jgi:hypothetical protein